MVYLSLHALWIHFLMNYDFGLICTILGSKSVAVFKFWGPGPFFYMRGPACERREQLGVWGRCLGGGGAENL